MTEAEYLARIAQRRTDWLAKYPDRAPALRAFARRQLGMGSRNEGDFVERAIASFEAETLRVVMGWPAMEDCVTETVLPPRPERAEVPPAVREALDLEDVPLSGRDRAAGKDV